MFKWYFMMQISLNDYLIKVFYFTFSIITKMATYVAGQHAKGQTHILQHYIF